MCTLFFIRRYSEILFDEGSTLFLKKSKEWKARESAYCYKSVSCRYVRSDKLPYHIANKKSKEEIYQEHIKIKFLSLAHEVQIVCSSSEKSYSSSRYRFFYGVDCRGCHYFRGKAIFIPTPNTARILVISWTSPIPIYP